MSAIATIQQNQMSRAVDPYTPTNMEQAMKLAEMVAHSDLAPKDYKGKPGNVFVAMQMGHELGLSPMQSVQNIAVINGRPSVWGDALLALCQGHASFEDIQETDDGSTATCTVKRRGRSPVTRSFSMDDAKRAGLLGKQGPWSNYPARMRQMRARGFALRDAFADALRGVQSAEEQEDVVCAEVVATSPVEASPQASAPAKSAVEATKAKLAAKQAKRVVSFADVMDAIRDAKTLDDLRAAARNINSIEGPDDREIAKAACEERRIEMLEPAHDADGVVTEEPAAEEREPGSEG